MRESTKRNRNRRQGATARRRPNRAPAAVTRTFGFLRRAALPCTVLFVVAAAGYFGKKFVDEAAQRPIGSIGVEGEFAYISQEQVSELVVPMIDGGFLQSPLTGIKEELEGNPWIARASVSRRWPDQLYISIVEEQPIARWGAEAFLNRSGDIIEVESTDSLKDLPLLSGSTGQAKSAMRNYHQLAQMLHPHGLRISEFYSNELFSWNVVLENGLKIHIGRDQTMEKIQRFLAVYKRELVERMDEVAVVDLRYGNGLAVQWKEVTVDSKPANRPGEKA